MIKAVLFDMDGLLLDTEKLLIKFWREAAGEFGYDMSRELALSLRSLHRSFAEPLLKRELGEDFDYAAVRSRRMELMNEYVEKNGIKLKKGAKELLEFLREEELTAAVVTATDSERAEKYLKATGIYDYFEKIICAPMVKLGKPEPDIYIYAAGELGLKPEECAALEDSPNGVKSAAAAGCVTIMVPDLTPAGGVLENMIYAQAKNLIEVIYTIKNL